LITGIPAGAFANRAAIPAPSPSFRPALYRPDPKSGFGEHQIASFRKRKTSEVLPKILQLHFSFCFTRAAIISKMHKKDHFPELLKRR
jgi:hypothetical protein